VDRRALPGPHRPRSALRTRRGGRLSIARFIERRAQQSPDKVALRFQDRAWSYAEFWQRIEQATRALAVDKGDRIAWLGYNHPDMLALLFAAARRGAILVPLNWRLAPAEHAALLRDCAPRLLYADAAFEAQARALGVTPGEWGDQGEPVLAGAEEDDVLIVYTSGTTGVPKGAVLTQRALLSNGANSVHAHELTQDDHVLTALPLFHVGGLNIQTLPALLTGAQVTLHARFEPGAWLHDVAALRPTLSLLVPATIAAVAAHPQWAHTDLSSLRMLNTGSMVVPDSLIEAFHARGIPVGQVYGSTETAPIAIALRREDAMRKVGSAGKPSPHCEVELVDGEIWVRGPNVMRGYWNDAAATAAALTGDGWFKTGDLARVDDEGYYWIMGRSKDVIISGGENIYPAELENVLADCPAIAESAVIGMADGKWGEAACAIVVRKPGAAIDEAAVIALFKDRLARYKHPRRVVFADSLPKNALGKVQKAELRKQLAPAK
jgi:fatty-acyl-CoA synthase